jgi:hypothetical protein
MDNSVKSTGFYTGRKPIAETSTLTKFRLEDFTIIAISVKGSVILEHKNTGVKVLVLRRLFNRMINPRNEPIEGLFRIIPENPKYSSAMYTLYALSPF